VDLGSKCVHIKNSQGQQKNQKVPNEMSIIGVPSEVIIWVITVSTFLLNQENACT
jgi:hypothetical protein